MILKVAHVAVARTKTVARAQHCSTTYDKLLSKNNVCYELLILILLLFPLGALRQSWRLWDPGHWRQSSQRHCRNFIHHNFLEI